MTISFNIKKWLQKPSVKIILGLVLVAAFLWFVPSNHLLTVPGNAVDVEPMIAGEVTEGTGEVMLTTVITQEANLALWLYGMINPRARLRPREVFLRPGETFEDYLDRSQETMRQSQETAKYVALQHSGYEVDLRGEGVEVVSIREDSPAVDLLEAGDVIIAAGGESINITEELQDIVGQYKPDDELEISVVRDDERLQKTVSLMEDPGEEGRALIGVGILTRNLSFDFPIELDIDAGAIGGPSAGLAFVLEIVDRLNPQLEMGRARVAATGTVNVRGEVGPVGGVTMKTWAAEEAGAEAFIVPWDNREEARAAYADLEIVPVRTVQEAIEYLLFEASALQPLIKLAA